MRCVLDTNVLVSGIFFGGIPGRILSRWAAGELTLVLSPAVLTEYTRVGRELGIRYAELEVPFDSIVALIAMNALIVDAPLLSEPVSDDPADDMFLAAALASHASIVVSGDKDLLRVSSWQGIVVLTPRQFHDQLLSAR